MDSKQVNEFDNLTTSEQTYLKTIYTQTRNFQPTSTLALAEALNIRPASVTNMLQKLENSHPDFVTYRKHYGISLTAEGEKAALRIIRRHRLIEQFLYQILEYPMDKIHQEAEVLEHAVSPYFIDRIAQLLDEPAFDPHGHPIPNSNLILEDSRKLVLLLDLHPGDNGIVRQISDQDHDLLIFLRSIGIYPGAEIKVMQVNPVDGTQQVMLVDGKQTQVLGKSIGSSIQVEIIGVELI